MSQISLTSIFSIYKYKLFDLDMSAVFKSLFSFTNAKDRELEIASKISKIETLVKELDKQKQSELPLKIKTILNTAFFEQKGESLFELVYKCASGSSPVEWVPVIGKAVSLLSGGSTFLKVIFEAQDYKIPIEKSLVPNYLFKNNLLNENSGYQGLSNSISGLMVPIVDYLFIRLLHAIHEIQFISISKDINEQYESDDFFLYMSRNPYLLLLRNYLAFVANNQKILGKLVGNIKMFFVDQLILRHRINKSTTYLRESSIFSSQRKIKPHFLLVIYLFLHQGRSLFEEKSMFFYELVSRYASLMESQAEIFFRFLFRVFLFAFSKSSAQTKVIDRLEGANEKEGIFSLERYTIKDYQYSIKSCDATEKKQFNDCKTILLKLLEKDQNLSQNGKIHPSLIRTLGCFLALDISINQLSGNQRNLDASDSLRFGTEASSLQGAIEKICIQFIKQKKSKSSEKLNKSNEQKMNQEVEHIIQLFLEGYKRKIDMSKFEDRKQTKSAAEVGIRGNSEDFTFSVETYRRDVEMNCWSVPLKDSEYLILYELFYGIAKFIDRYIPGEKSSKEPRINLRYFCNPLVFMLSVIVIILIFKIMF